MENFLAVEAAKVALWKAEVAAKAWALGLGPLTMADCPKLDALYVELNASGLDWFSNGHVGTLPDGRVAYIGETFGWAGK